MAPQGTENPLKAGSSGSAAERPPVERLSVKPSEIEKGLDRLRTSAQSKAGSAPQPRMRAVLANIVVLVSDTGQFGNDSSLDKFISRMAVAHPSRFFIIRINRESIEGRPPIDSQVSSRQITSDSGAFLSSEEIYLDVDEEALHYVPNLLLSLFVADVDVVLVIPEPFGHRKEEVGLLKDLRRFARLVLFDSSSFQNYGPEVRLLLEQCGSLEEHPREGHVPQPKRFSDVSWRRTKRWRSLLSECFDSERLSSAQNSVSRIKFFSCRTEDELSRGSLSSDTYLIAGWCAACLNWNLSNAVWKRTDRGIILTFEQGRGATQLEFISWTHLNVAETSKTSPRDPAFGLAGIEIVLQPSMDSVRLRIAKLFDKGAAEIFLGAAASKEGADSCEFSVRYAPFLSQTVDELVFRDILSNRGEEIYRRSLEASLRLAEIIAAPASK